MRGPLMSDVHTFSAVSLCMLLYIVHAHFWNVNIQFNLKFQEYTVSFTDKNGGWTVDYSIKYNKYKASTFFFVKQSNSKTTLDDHFMIIAS